MPPTKVDNRGLIIPDPKTGKCFYVSKTLEHKPGKPLWIGPIPPEEAKKLQEKEA